MKKIYVNGCSETKGTDDSLDHRELAWPYRLQQLLNVDVIVNSSKEGASNERIVRSTMFDWYAQRNKPDLCIIQWSYPERFETPKGKNERPWTDNGYWRTHYPFHASYNDPNRNPSDWDPFYRNFYRIDDDIVRHLMAEKLYMHMLLLQNFFENNNQKYVFLNYQHANDNTFIQEEKMFRKNIKWDNFLHTENICCMFHALRHAGYRGVNKKRTDGTIDTHFGSDAHQYIAEKLSLYITQGIQLSGGNK